MKSEEKIWRTIDIDRRGLLHGFHKSDSLAPNLVRQVDSQRPEDILISRSMILNNRQDMFDRCSSAHLSSLRQRVLT
jgi:hypothetical protein